MVKLDLDRLPDTARLDHTVEHGTVAQRDLGRGSARGLARRGVGEHADDVRRGTREVERMSTERIDLRHICVRDGGCRGFDRGLARVLRESVREHTVLDHAKTDDRERSDADQDGCDHERLTALTAHGVHSMRRDALAVTTKRGSPTNPSGTGSV